MKQQDWTEQLRQRMADHQMDVPDKVWAGIEQRTAAGGRHARFAALRRWAAGMAACTLLVAGGWQLATTGRHAPMQPQHEQAAAQTQPQATAAQATAATAAGGDTRPLAPATHGTEAAAHKAGHHALAEARRATTDGQPADGGQPTTATPTAATPTEQTAAPAEKAGPAAHGNESRPAAQPRASQHSPTPPRSPSSGRRQAAVLTLHASNLTAYGGTSQTEPMLMNNAYMGPASQALARRGPVYLASHEEKARHHMPLTIGLSARLPLSRHCWLATGLDYVRLSSTFTQLFGPATATNKQQLHYVGIPLSAGWSFWHSPRLQAYASGGAEGLLNVKTQVSTGHIDRDRVQFSLLAAAGMEYRAARRLGVYVQPGLRFYPDNGSHVQSIFKERPLQFDLQVGLRYTLR